MAKKTKEGTALDSSGVVLFAFGHRVYYQAAYNLAFSIRYYSPNVPITLFVDSIESALKHCPNLVRYVDQIDAVDKELLYTNGKFDPARLKVSLYDLLPYENNLYLDVDAVALKDIQPLIDELTANPKPYIAHTVGYHTIDKGRSIDSMQWAWGDEIWSRYKLSDKATLPAINSSLQFIKKHPTTEKIYATAKDLLLNNPIPLEKLRMKWGGGQPDELYMNISFAINEYDPADQPIDKNGTSEAGHIHFASRRGLSYAEVIEKYYLQSYYGGKRFTALFYTEWLDRMLKNMMGVHEYKIHDIVQFKHAGKQ